MFSTFSLATFLQITIGSFVVSYLGCIVLESLGIRIKKR